MKGKGRSIVSKNLRRLREVHRMTQEDLAAAAGVDRSYVSEIENDKFSISIDLLDKLAEVYGLELWELVHPDTAEKVKAPDQT